MLNSGRVKWKSSKHHCQNLYRKLRSHKAKLAPFYRNGKQILRHFAPFEGYFQPGLEWKPIPDVRHGNKKTPANELFTTQEQFHEVPNVIHPGWSQKERERAEVRHACMTMGDDMHLACSKSSKKWQGDLRHIRRKN